jgi:hypothetical protein
MVLEIQKIRVELFDFPQQNDSPISQSSQCHMWICWTSQLGLKGLQQENSENKSQFRDMGLPIFLSYNSWRWAYLFFWVIIAEEKKRKINILRILEPISYSTGGRPPGTYSLTSLGMNFANMAFASYGVLPYFFECPCCCLKRWAPLFLFVCKHGIRAA